jgi:hypothetical protein
VGENRMLINTQWGLQNGFLDNRKVKKFIRSCTRRAKKGRTIPVTGCGGPYNCETSRVPHFLDNRLIDDGDEGFNQKVINIRKCQLLPSHFKKQTISNNSFPSMYGLEF